MWLSLSIHMACKKRQTGRAFLADYLFKLWYIYYHKTNALKTFYSLECPV